MSFLVAAAWMLLGQAAPIVEPVTGLQLVRIPAGAFVMGSPASEPRREEQELAHHVTVSRAFDLARTEVTQDQWRRVMGTTPSHFARCGGDCPVESVSLEEIREFLARLSARSPLGPFRLPTEAEWEYACRAATRTAFAFGDVLTASQANVDFRWDGTRMGPGAFVGGPTPVGRHPPNGWGIFDMHGNVWEWTEDEHCPYPAAGVVDPRPSCGAALRVIRGGSWAFGPDSARCALRYTHLPNERGFSLGFRVARDAR
jgi:formylglycine-generating enzyme required for sulfatase activity